MKIADKKIVASANISELQSSDIYLTIRARLFDTKANLNGVRVTEAFLDEIVENEGKYICIPLCADVRGLIGNRTIGHMYDARTGEFHSTQIGSFCHFEKEVTQDNTYLVGSARVMKRNKAVCKALSNLFAENALKFSFEITCAAYEDLPDGTILIDVDPKNFLEGMAVVTFPACEDAVALDLVAECLGKGDENMTDAIETIAENEVLTENTETVETAETVEEVAEVEVAETEADVAAIETAEAETPAVEETAEISASVAGETETAEKLFVDETHVDVDTVTVYNCDTGEEVSQRTETITTVRTPIEVAETETEEEEVEVEDEKEDEAEDETAACGKKEKECAEDHESTLVAEMAAKIEELTTLIANLQADVDKMKTTAETVQVVASAEESLQMNPFMAEMSVPQKYSLLEKEDKSNKHYSLLDRV